MNLEQIMTKSEWDDNINDINYINDNLEPSDLLETNQQATDALRRYWN